ncbi:unnamed protein product [marine sediment metagenome]|uniref:Uncharacterized protein n=1 Tax=marine sediment metagenome TaxID=412755 RepID=X0ZJ95_9ZZZZ
MRTNKIEEFGTTISDISSELEDSKIQITGFENTTAKSNERTDELSTEIQELNNMLTAIRDEKTSLTSQLMELDNLLIQKNSKIQELSEENEAKDKLICVQAARLEELEIELGELKPLKEEKWSFPYEIRNSCPMCQAVGKDIREVEDREKNPYYNGPIPMYAKKYVCKKCGYEWN